MSTATACPFALHRADPEGVRQLGRRLTTYGGQARTVGSEADRLGLLAGTVHSDGLFDPIRSALHPALSGGVMLASAGQVGRLALDVWGGAVRDYNRTVEGLNAEWAAAGSGNFGVGELELDRAAASPAQVESAAQRHADAVADAKAALWAALLRRRVDAEHRLDAIADGVAQLLGNSADPGVQLLAASAFAEPATATAETTTFTCEDGVIAVPEGVCVSPDHYTAAESQSLEEIAGELGDAFAFVFADPRECVGEDASAAGCGLEVAGILPIFKAPKWGVKLAGYLKRADKAADDAVGVPRVHPGKQGKHIPGHPHFEDGKSILDADPAELAKRAGTGTPVGTVPRGEPGFKEIVDYGYPIGEFVSRSGEVLTTTRATIHYAKDGIHIVPARPAS